MSDALSYMLQRLTAAILAPLVLLHLGLIIYAIEGGLSAEEILSRTQANILWPMLYGVFVLAAAIHAPLGLRNIIREWMGKSGPLVDGLMAVFALVLLLCGGRAVMAISG